MRIKIYLSKSKESIRKISESFKLGVDNVVKLSWGAIFPDDENIPQLFNRKGYFQCSVESVSLSDEFDYNIYVLD